MLVRVGEKSLLIDAGLSAQTLVSRTKKFSVPPDSIGGILLTHEHHDHSVGAGVLARRMRIPVLANSETLQALSTRDELDFPAQEIPTGTPLSFGAITVQSFPIPHNAVAPVGFTLTIGECKIAYATDIGSRTPELATALSNASLIILEANHDLHWLLHGSYSDEMKARVASPIGHLSNADCAEALAHRLEDGTPCTIWLAHLSRMNNTPALAKRTILDRLGKHHKTPYTLEVALRDHPSLSWKYGQQAHQLDLLSHF